MLTRLRIAHFKRFAHADIALAARVVLIGDNGAGKTSVLQALALWELGLRTWHARRAGKGAAQKRLGVTLGRRDLTQIPVPSASQLWRHTDVRSRGEGGRGHPRRIELEVEGTAKGQPFRCGLEFEYSNEESLLCRPLRRPGFDEHLVTTAEFADIPDAAAQVRVAYLPPLAGLCVTEPKWDRGRVNVLLGEGQAAQVVRNLCFHLYNQRPDRGEWLRLCEHIEALYGVRLLHPEFIAERGELVMKFRDQHGTRLDLSAAGQGFLQTLLLLSHLYMHPGAVLLLDEPDAHLELLRQRHTLRLLMNLAEQQGSQVIATSHSEVLVSEVLGRGAVVMLEGGDDGETRAHLLAGAADGEEDLAPGSPLGWEQHYQAAATGWVLYLPRPRDLDALAAFARLLGHAAAPALGRAFVHYVGGGAAAPQRARRHFAALKRRRPALRGLALYDRDAALGAPGLDEKAPPPPDDALPGDLQEHAWQRGDLAGYHSDDAVLVRYAEHARGEAHTLWTAAPRRSEPRRQLQLGALLSAEERRREEAMRSALSETRRAPALSAAEAAPQTNGRTLQGWLAPVLTRYAGQLAAPQLDPAEYHHLVALMSPDEVDPEVLAQLAAVAALAAGAAPPTRTK